MATLYILCISGLKIHKEKQYVSKKARALQAENWFQTESEIQTCISRATFIQIDSGFSFLGGDCLLLQVLCVRAKPSLEGS